MSEGSGPESDATAGAVTQESLDTVLEKLDAKAQKRDERLHARIDHLSQPAAAAAAAPAEARATTPRVYTRAELDSLVEMGPENEGITAQQRDAQLDLQERTAASAAQTRADTRQDQRMNERDRVERAKDRLDEYREAIPALSDKSSEEFAQVQAAYSDLVRDEGLDEGLPTQVLAAQAVFGPASQHKRVEARPADAHEEVGGGGGDGESKGGGDKAPKGVSADQMIYAAREVPESEREGYYEYARKIEAKKQAGRAQA